MKNKMYVAKITFLFGVVLVLGILINDLHLDSHQATAQTAPDAIALRIVPNSYHYPPMRWYRKQGFEGSPTRLEVDGYNAVQDGRTVYVNVGNINDGQFYSNIYIISFTQEATPETLDIFQRILENWEFNTNVSESGECAISTHNCFDNEDCSAGYECNDNNKCIPADPQGCSRDSECPSGIFCNSEKAKLIRDTERLEKLTELRRIFFKYKEHNQHKYPRLPAGTYLSNKTISTWPSWTQTLEKKLQPIIDEYSVYDRLPQDSLNTLGNCGDNRFDPQTCWDKNKKEFAGTINEDGRLKLPDADNSFSYVYTVAPNNKFDLCVPLELSDVKVSNVEQGWCADSSVAYSLAGKSPSPIINCDNLSGSPGEEFSGYISAQSPAGDPIDSWNLGTSGEDWSSWSAAPVLKPGLSSTRKIYAEEAGYAGTYNVSVTVTDVRGSQATKVCQLNLGNYPPRLSVSCPSPVRVNHDYNCDGISAYDPDGNTVTFLLDGQPPGLSINPDTGELSGAPSVSGVYDMTIAARDELGATTEEIFSLRVNTYCGDEVIQDPNMEGQSEECDTYGGDGTGPDDQYECSDNCQWTGGYCGDGNVNSSYEDCEINISISEKRATLQDQGVPDVSDKSDAEVEAVYDGACNDCQFQCTNWSQAGRGCYIGDTCEKGSYRCNINTGRFECVPFDPPLYDYCCESMKNHDNVEWGQNQLAEMSVTRIKPAAASTANSDTFYCDDICHEIGEVCVGVAVTDEPSNYCKSIKCHHGVDCALEANQDNNDCRTVYPYTRGGSSNMCTDPETYNIGYTSCLCN